MTEIDEFEKRVHAWGKELGKFNIPASRSSQYVHILIYHVADYLRHYGHISFFTQQPCESLYKLIKELFEFNTNHHSNWMLHLLKRDWVEFPFSFFVIWFFLYSIVLRLAISFFMDPTLTT